MISEVTGVDSSYCIPDVVWDRIITLLSSSIRRRKKKKAGRPRMDDRKAMSAIFYVLRTGCQWNALPRSLGASRYRYMTDSRNGERLVFSSECGSMDCRYMIKKLGLIGNGRLWMALLQKRLLGEKSTGPNPTDRVKSGTKRSILVDGKGLPLGVCVDGV